MSELLRLRFVNLNDASAAWCNAGSRLLALGAAVHVFTPSANCVGMPTLEKLCVSVLSIETALLRKIHGYDNSRPAQQTSRPPQRLDLSQLPVRTEPRYQQGDLILRQIQEIPAAASEKADNDLGPGSH